MTLKGHVLPAVVTSPIWEKLYHVVNPMLGSDKENVQDVQGGDFCLNPKPIEHDHLSLPIPPPGYEQCVALPAAPQADYVVSPLAMVSLFDWDEEYED